MFDKDKKEKYLKVLLPENLDYTDIFTDILNKYTDKNELLQVKTTNLGSMFELKYLVNVKDNVNEKMFIDELRERNGNLKISLSSEIGEIEL